MTCCDMYVLKGDFVIMNLTNTEGAVYKNNTCEYGKLILYLLPKIYGT